ncbi:MAG: endonuclease Q family protein [Candidatus Diapherotrites archaeon]|nr:endonuclease Q family protein [Candidatus Diapherotrites archaeon]
MSNLKLLDCDMHVHGPNSGGVSKNMSIPLMAEQAQLKGLHVLATGDCLNKEWLVHLKNSLIESNGTFSFKDSEIQFILSTEISDLHNVHQLCYFPDFASVDLFREKLIQQKVKLDGKGFGRPWVRIGAEKLAETVIDECKGLIGPAHGFTPYFGVFAHFNSVQQCFGSMASEIKFMELGLSADSDIADLIESNHSLQYFSCSDAHSAWSDKLGREFMRIRMTEGSLNELKKVLDLKGERRIETNIGLDAREGKYHCTACSECFAKYSLDQALKLKMKCMQCGKSIKRGVRDLALQLHNPESKSKPEYRAEYVRSIPLAEIIKIAFKAENAHSKKVQTVWRNFVEEFKSEIAILLDVPIENLIQKNPEVGKKIQAFRNNWVLFMAGGGGNYGVPIICDSLKELEQKKKELKNKLDCHSELQAQKILTEF